MAEWIGMYGRYEVVERRKGYAVYDNFNGGLCTPDYPKRFADAKCEELADQWIMDWCPCYPEDFSMKREAVVRVRERRARRKWQREFNKLICD